MIYLDTYNLKRYYFALTNENRPFSEIDFSKAAYAMVPESVFKVFKELGDPPKHSLFGIAMCNYRGFEVCSHPILYNRIAWIDRKGVVLGVTIIEEENNEKNEPEDAWFRLAIGDVKTDEDGRTTYSPLITSMGRVASINVMKDQEETRKQLHHLLDNSFAEICAQFTMMKKGK